MIDLYKQNPSKKALSDRFTLPKSVIKIVGIGYLVGSNLLMVTSFLIAYFDRSYQTWISYNLFHEVHFELVFISVGTLLSILVYYWIIKEERAKRFINANN